MARLMPAAVVACVSVDTHDEGVAMRNDRHGSHRTFPLEMDMVDGQRSVPVRVGITTEQNCDGSRVQGADKLLIKIPKWAR